MAINFGNTIMEGEIAPSVQTQAPVQDDSGSILAKGFGDAAKFAGAVTGSIFEQNQTNQNDKFLAGVQNKFLDFADAVEQGMDPSRARLEARDYYREVLANAPGLREEIDKIWTNTVNSNGLGYVIQTGTQDQINEQNKDIEASKLGITRIEYDALLTSQQELKLLEQRSQGLTLGNNVQLEALKAESIKALGGYVNNAFPVAQAQINDAVARIEANPQNKAQIVSETTALINTSLTQIQQATGGLGAEYIGEPITKLLTTFTEYANGTVEATALQAQMDLTKKQLAAMYYSDPKVAAAIAQSSIFNELGIADALGDQMFDTEVLTKMAEISERGIANIFGMDASSQKFADTLNDIIATPNMSQEAIDEAKSWYGAIADGTYMNERMIKDPLAYKDAIHAFGTPEAAEFFRANGGVDSEYMRETARIFQQYYGEALSPAISEYWRSAPVSIMATQPGGIGGSSVTSRVIQDLPISEMLTPVWNGSAVEFVPKPEYMENPSVVGLARSVNSGENSIGFPLNEYIRAIAATTGTDAKSVWESPAISGRLFGIGEETLVDRVNSTLDENDPNNPDLKSFQMDDEVGYQASVFSAPESAQLPPIDPAYTDVEGINYDDYLPSIRRSESGGDDQAQAQTSSAFGRYQFLKSTWTGLVDKYPNAGLTYDGRSDPNQQEVAIRLFTAENARQLTNNNISLNNGTLYAAHFLGASDAVKALQSPPSTSLESILPARTIAANSFLRGKDVAWFKAWAARKGNA